MRYWNVCMLFTCDPEYTRNASRYQWRNSSPFDQKDPQPKPHTRSFNHQTSKRHCNSVKNDLLLMVGITLSQQNEVWPVVCASLARSFPTTTTSGPQLVQMTTHACHFLVLQHDHHRMSCSPPQPSHNVHPSAVTRRDDKLRKK